MKKSLILHIGTEKTGTTTLQAFLLENADTLTRLGYEYPCDPWRDYVERDAHSPVAACLVDEHVDFIPPEKRMSLDTVLQQLADDIGSCSADTIILSSEHFSSRVHDRSSLEAFRRGLGRMFGSVRVVCYVRDQLGMAASTYSTDVLTGRRSPFDPAEVSPESRHYDYVAMLDLWSSVFGKENVIVREYRPRGAAGGDVCSDFCRVCGIPEGRLGPVAALNRSLGEARLDLLRAMNAHLPSFSEDESGWRDAQEIRRIVLDHMGPELGPAFRIGESDARAIVDRFQDHNQLLNERYLGGTLSARWFSVPDLCSNGGAEADGGRLAEESVVSEASRALVSVAMRLIEREGNACELRPAMEGMPA